MLKEKHSYNKSSQENREKGRVCSYPFGSLVPRLHPAFQYCTRKSGRAWCAKSRVVRHRVVKIMNMGSVNHKISTLR